MKIVQINTVCGTGSVGRIALDLYRLIEENENQSLFVYGRNEAPEWTHSFKTGTKIDFISHVLQNFIWDQSGFGSRTQTKRFLEFLEQEKPDLIHIHNIHGFYLQVELLFDFIKEHHIPVVWTLHDCWPFTGHCAYYDYVNCNNFREGCQTCKHHASLYPYALFHDNAGMNYQKKRMAFTGVSDLTLVTPSRWLADQVTQSHLREYPVRVIPNGLDLTVFSPGKSAVDKGYVHILGVANVWERRKGLIYFDELAKCLPENYCITLVGLNAKQKRYFTRKYARNRVCPMGKTGNLEELAQYYRNADIYVNPTLEDNFPTTNLEALACGTPVVSFDSGGSCEMLDSSCGVRVAKGNIEELMRGIETARKIKTQDCRKRAQMYDKIERLKEYLVLYQELG